MEVFIRVNFGVISNIRKECIASSTRHRRVDGCIRDYFRG